MSRARLSAAAVALLAALLLARVAFAPDPPPMTLAVPAVPAVPAAPPGSSGTSGSSDAVEPPSDPFAASYDGAAPPAPPGASAPPAAPAAPSGPAPSPAAAPAPLTLVDARDALARLDADRAAAYAAPAGGDPDTWAVRACACHRDDTARLRALARDGLALRGHAVTVESVAFAAPPTATRAALLVTDRAAAYVAVDAAGRTVSRWPASGPRRWRVTLVPVAGRWVLGELARAP